MGIESEPCIDKVKRYLAEVVFQLLKFGEVEAPPSPPLGFRLQLLSLLNPWHLLCPAS